MLKNTITHTHTQTYTQTHTNSQTQSICMYEKRFIIVIKHLNYKELITPFQNKQNLVQDTFQPEK